MKGWMASTVAAALLTAASLSATPLHDGWQAQAASHAVASRAVASQATVTAMRDVAADRTQGAPIAASEDGARITAVVELFTSQGCPACPAADRDFATYADRDDVLALSWHVDYWNYMGWRDTFAKSAHSTRQRAYANQLDQGVYTPQIIVNGMYATVGTRKAEVKRLTEAARTMPLVPLSIDYAAGSISVSIDVPEGARAKAEGAQLYLVLFRRSATVDVGAGENGGRKLVYRNIVRDTQPLGRVMQGRLTVTLSHADLTHGAHDAAALIVQQDGPGPVIAAASLERPWR